MPLPALEQVESIYKNSLLPKETQKGTAKKSFGRAARREEQPLFDINPRTAWEFLSRAQSEKGEVGVFLQKEEEQFTQWKEEEKEVVKPHSPSAEPTSFAEALLRKLNFDSAPNEIAAKGISGSYTLIGTDKC